MNFHAFDRKYYRNNAIDWEVICQHIFAKKSFFITWSQNKRSYLQSCHRKTVHKFIVDNVDKFVYNRFEAQN